MHFLHLIPFIQSRLNLFLILLHTRACGIGDKFKLLREDMSVQAIHLNTWESKTGGFQWVPQQPEPHTKLKDTIPNQLSEKERIVLLHILIKFRCEWNSWLIFIGDLSPNFILFFIFWRMKFGLCRGLSQQITCYKIVRIWVWFSSPISKVRHCGVFYNPSLQKADNRLLGHPQWPVYIIRYFLGSRIHSH